MADQWPHGSSQPRSQASFPWAGWGLARPQCSMFAEPPGLTAPLTRLYRLGFVTANGALQLLKVSFGNNLKQKSCKNENGTKNTLLLFAQADPLVSILSTFSNIHAVFFRVIGE